MPASLLCLLLSCTSSSQPSLHSPTSKPASITIHLASSPWPPYVDTAEDARAALDLVATALARAGYIADNQIAALDSLVEGLKSEKYDGSAALWQSEERKQFLLYSNAYLENRMMLVGRAGSDVQASSFSQLQGKKIGLVQDYAYGPEVDDAKEPLFVRGASTETNLRALLHGELDYVLADALVVHQLAQHHPQQVREKLAVGNKPLLTRSLHLALRKSFPDAARVIAAFNQQLSKMLSDGSYHTALHVDWIHADIDGDGILELVAAGDQLGMDPPSAGYRPVSSAPEGSGSDGPRFVVKGVAYDSWQAVPGDYKTAVNTPGDKPAALRASVFEF